MVGKKLMEREYDNSPLQQGGKSEKKARVVHNGCSEEPPPPMPQDKAAVTGKKKGKKAIAEAAKAKGNDHDAAEVVFAGKKKGGGGRRRVFSASSVCLLGDGEGLGLAGKEEEEGEEELVVSLSATKKPSKASKKGSDGGIVFTALAFHAINDDDNDGGEVVDGGRDENDEDELVKSSNGGKKGGGALFSADIFGEIDTDGESIGPITFSGKKKKSSKSSKKASPLTSTLADGDVRGGDEEDEDDDDDNVSLVAFSGKKRSSKKKSSSTIANVSDETGFGSESVDAVVVEPEQLSFGISNIDAENNVSKSEEVAEISKSKKKKQKKNKSVRTVQEEEDLDKILAELGEGPPMAKPDAPLPQGDKVQPHPKAGPAAEASGEKEGEEETVESAAAANKKKKKKKKEKEKEKKVAAAGSAPENETKEVKAEPIESKQNGSFTKAAEKKVPKHVREMQEALARRKEAEERKKREEEERIMKEEDERRRQEELQRQAEEARRRKKEKEKEKIQRKKQEGKLLTCKQKEEARRLEIMRKQFLNSPWSVTLPTGESGAPAKRPIYQAKKPKPAHHHQSSAAAVETAEGVEAKGNQETTTDACLEKVEEQEADQVEKKVELPEAVEDNGADEDDLDDEWDAKSWDEVILTAKGSFADEEVDFESKSVVELETKTAVTALHAAASKKTVSKSEAGEIENRKQANVVAVDKTRNPNPDSKREPPKYAVPREPPKSTLPKETPKCALPPTLSEENLRSPICCIMGHVDAGKTKLLDCIRGTNVQEGEAGGITQQIGATYFPAENIRERTRELKADAKLKVPGLLVIDTPGHKPFTKLRSRGSGLCDIAILVVDIMHGLKQQTTEKTNKKTTEKTAKKTTEETTETTTELLNLLKNRNTEFIIALNKVDRLYGWKTFRNSPIVKAMKQQTKDVQNEFNMRVTQIITQFKEHGLNTALYYKNKEMGKTFNIVPTSAISGEGIPDLLLLLVQWTQKTMVEKLTYNEEVKCTVLEVKVLEGHGTTLDVVLVNGVLHEGDQIVICGMQGPIVTTIRALLTPHPMKELRVKGTYLHHEEIKAAMGIKITARGLEHAIAGTDLYVVKPDDDLENVKEFAMEDMRSVMNRIDTSGVGVCVQASTLGSLEALLELLKSEVKVPVSGISIGPVHKKDVMKASIMLVKNRKYATILAFDVKVTPEARELADELGVKIFIADVFYQLTDQFKAYIENINAEERREAADQTVFPCVLKILPDCIFNKKDPIVLGVDVLEGIAKVGTPLCIPSREFVDIGRIASIHYNDKPVDSAKKGQQIAIKIVGSNPEEQHKMYGRHFDIDDELVSHISEIYTPNPAAMTKDELNLLMKLKNVFKIQRGGLM